MQTRRRELFTTVRTEGALLPPDLLQRVAGLDKDLEGLRPEDYHLSGEKLNEATSRAWARMRPAWGAFEAARRLLPEADPATTVTRDRWLLPLFDALGYGRLFQEKSAFVLDEKEYPISHRWQGRVPIHLLGAGVDLDHRTPGVIGAARMSPHSLVQELLNRDPAQLWGILSNGLRLRVLRDNVSLTRQAFVEFDLDAMMRGEVYSDFVLLWLLCHESRVEAEKPAECWLEAWRGVAQDQGARVRERLRDGVQDAIVSLGRGFLSHPANDALREKLRSGQLHRDEYYRQILRTVYRVIFLFVAEDRGLLLVPDAPDAAKERYARWYSTARLRRLADRRSGTPHPDLWRTLRLVMDALGRDEGCLELALPALGSYLWRSVEATPDLEGCDLPNRDLLEAVRALAWTTDAGARRPVDYRNLGSEELGSVYEALLELHPDVAVEATVRERLFTLDVAAGSDRKTSGSYYTPPSLVQSLLDTALEPVVAKALAGKRGPDAERAILALRVCDPACGSGHFLVAAAHRLARHLASARSGEEHPAPAEVQRALRDVIADCIHGVDINPMAVELCQVSLWMEAMEPGRPLAFLEPRIRCGNSLLGATPALVAAGVKDEAFKPLTGDDPEVAARWRLENRSDSQAQQELADARPTGPDHATAWSTLGAERAKLPTIDDRAIEGIHARERQYQQTVASETYRRARAAADAWGSAFVWPLTDAWSAVFLWRKEDGAPPPPTDYRLKRLRDGVEALPAATQAEVRRIAASYQLFHWHLEFPDVFRQPGPKESPGHKECGWAGGFDVVLGNPPWEMTELKEQEWFAARDPGVAKAPSADVRKRMIGSLAEENPGLHAEFLEARRRSDGEAHLVRTSGRFPLCASGRMNTYALFAELMRQIVSPAGRVGFIVPTGIATDFTTREFFQDLIESRALVSLYDFENTAGARLFPGVGHRRFKLCTVTVRGHGDRADPDPEFVFYAHFVPELRDEWRRFSLSQEDVARLNPNTRTCPIFRSKRDAELTKAIYRRVPVLVGEQEERPCTNPWGLGFKQGLFNMASDSGLFRTAAYLDAAGFRLVGNEYQRDESRFLPLYEAKMVHHYDHRFGDYADHPKDSEDTQLPDVPLERLQDPRYQPLPRYWVDRREVLVRIARVPRKLAKAAIDEDAALAAAVLEAWPVACRRETQGLALAPALSAGAKKLLPELIKEGIRFTSADESIVSSTPEPLAAAWALIEARSPRWLLGWRDICRAGDVRTVIASVLPQVAAGDTCLLAFPGEQTRGTSTLLLACWSSFALDYAARQKIGGTHMKYHVFKQLPVPAPTDYEAPCGWDPSVPTRSAWLFPRVLELAYTAWDLEYFARDSGRDGPPFRWDDGRRFWLRAELDAAFFHLYGLERDDVAYVMDTFLIVRRDDVKRHGTYRTKDAILAIYDELATAQRTGRPYVTRLDPPPADERVAHPARGAEGHPGVVVPLRYPTFVEEDTPAEQVAWVAEPEAPYHPDSSVPPPSEPLARAVAWLRECDGPRSRADLMAALHLTEADWAALRDALAAHPSVEKTGAKRGTRYSWRPAVGGDAFAVLRGLLQSVEPGAWAVPTGVDAEQLVRYALLASLFVLPSSANRSEARAVVFRVCGPRTVEPLIGAELTPAWRRAVGDGPVPGEEDVQLALHDAVETLKLERVLREDAAADRWSLADPSSAADVLRLEWVFGRAKVAAAAAALAQAIAASRTGRAAEDADDGTSARSAE